LTIFPEKILINVDIFAKGSKGGKVMVLAQFVIPANAGIQIFQHTAISRIKCLTSAILQIKVYIVILH
jgi:hypothetical protein